ncbi:MAG TPA: AEC family transporter [Chloroflexota bacterium]|nr:AEC family transporter [Chloroflexota bacterium]
MSTFLTLMLCLVAGVMLRRCGRVPADAHRVVNAIIVFISLPALTLHHFHALPLGPAQLLPVLLPWALLALAGLLLWGAGRALRLPTGGAGALALVAGLGNISFVALPMLGSLHASCRMGLPLPIDQLGSYVALSTAGVITASMCLSDSEATPGAVLRKVARFPPFIALVLALLLGRVGFPPALDAALSHIGDTLALLALLSVGLQLRFEGLRVRAGLTGLRLACRLALCLAVVIAPLGMCG